MLLNCNKGCKVNGGTTEGRLDPDSYSVICTVCEDILTDISPFCKDVMKSSGDIIRKKSEKAFMFSCVECKRNVEAVMSGGVLCGIDCEIGNCNIKVTEPMFEAIKLLRG
tara:strand:+ start:66802 stop:67131 length:330 start_codon:yes stop_codon:yes gene_type:complete